MFSLIKDIFFPKKCYSCNKEGYFLCNNCLNKRKLFSSICYVCKKKSVNFKVHKSCLENIYYDNVYILSHYSDNLIKKLIKDGKFYGKKDIFEDLGFYLSKILNFDSDKRSNYIISFVPMTLFSKLKRGYNQSEILAKTISNSTGIYLNKNIIIRNKKTRQQSKLTKKERIQNLENAFKINKRQLDNIDNKTIILIDDVISTGTTVNTISKLLKENGVKKVIVLVVASD